MIRFLLLAASCLAATQASALTCVSPDPLASFRAARDAPENYVVLSGRLQFDPARKPDGSTVPPGGAETALEPVEARFEGHALGLAGFTTPVRATLLLRPTCLGQFCGSIGPGETWLLFAQPGGTGRYSVEIDPCGQWAFDRVPQATLDTLSACIHGAPCGE